MSPARRSALTVFAGEPETRAASAVRLATPREWPARYGLFMSTRSAIASMTSSKSASATLRESGGSASRRISQSEAFSRPSRRSAAWAQQWSAAARWLYAVRPRPADEERVVPPRAQLQRGARVPLEAHVGQERPRLLGRLGVEVNVHLRAEEIGGRTLVAAAWGEPPGRQSYHCLQHAMR